MTTDQTGSSAAPSETGSFARQWHYRPGVPIVVSPFFTWPPEPRRMLRWVRDRWFTLAENSVLVVLAAVCWFFLTPSLEMTQTLAVDWIAVLYVKNLVLMILVAGGLHLYFYIVKGQNRDLK